jgi:hypothetical protein
VDHSNVVGSGEVAESVEKGTVMLLSVDSNWWLWEVVAARFWIVPEIGEGWDCEELKVDASGGKFDKEKLAGSVSGIALMSVGNVWEIGERSLLSFCGEDVPIWGRNCLDHSDVGGSGEVAESFEKGDVMVLSAVSNCRLWEFVVAASWFLPEVGEGWDCEEFKADGSGGNFDKEKLARSVCKIAVLSGGIVRELIERSLVNFCGEYGPIWGHDCWFCSVRKLEECIVAELSVKFPEISGELLCKKLFWTKYVVLDE